MGFGDLNAGPHACRTNTSSTEATTPLTWINGFHEQIPRFHVRRWGKREALLTRSDHKTEFMLSQLPRCTCVKHALISLLCGTGGRKVTPYKRTHVESVLEVELQFIWCLRWKQTRKLLENPGKAKKIVTNHVMFKFPKNTSIFSKSPPLVITFLPTTRPSYSLQIILLFSYWAMVTLEPVVRLEG